jgi:hypothetical protein
LDHCRCYGLWLRARVLPDLIFELGVCMRVSIIIIIIIIIIRLPQNAKGEEKPHWLVVCQEIGWITHTKLRKILKTFS